MSNIIAIIPVYNVVKSRLDRIVQKLILDLRDLNIDVLIVDDSSTDKTRALLEGLSDFYLFLSKNVGFAASVSLAFKFLSSIKSYKYIIISNNDIIVYSKRNLGKLIEFLDNEPKIGATQGMILDPNMRVYSLGGGITTRGYALSLCMGVFPTSPTFRRKCTIDGGFTYVSYIDGAFGIYRFDILRDIGVPYPTYLPYSDDWVLGILIWKRGFRVATLEIPVVIHLVSATYGRQRFRLTQRRAAFHGFMRGFSLAHGGIHYFLRDLIRAEFRAQYIKNAFYGSLYFSKVQQLKSLCNIVLAKDTFRAFIGKIYITDLFFKRCNI